LKRRVIYCDVQAGSHTQHQVAGEKQSAGAIAVVNTRKDSAHALDTKRRERKNEKGEHPDSEKAVGGDSQCGAEKDRE
jgi:hypothetical protein